MTSSSVLFCFVCSFQKDFTKSSKTVKFLFHSSIQGQMINFVVHGTDDEDTEDTEDTDSTTRLSISYLRNVCASLEFVARHETYTMRFCLCDWIAHGQNRNPIGIRSVHSVFRYYSDQNHYLFY
mmetsp:Transcript_48584/g.55044  ORF Transcript_48584/g.55044 Transcript_48584/m.55044 type:complete len:124 (-) Transcript_48584:10-381(-)